MEQAKQELHITFLNTDWMDSTDYVISIEDLVTSVNFIHAGLRHGGSVLVHCAQVRSHHVIGHVCTIIISGFLFVYITL